MLNLVGIVLNVDFWGKLRHVDLVNIITATNENLFLRIHGPYNTSRMYEMSTMDLKTCYMRDLSTSIQNIEETNRESEGYVRNVEDADGFIQANNQETGG